MRRLLAQFISSSSISLVLACTPPAASDESGSTGEPASTSSGASSAASSTGEAPTTGGSSGGESSTGAPQDGLRINELQAMGTHNSYHISPGPSVKDLDYTHRPLPEQLDGGARQFELDVHFGQPDQPIDVYHLEVIDTGTTCATLTDCMQGLRGWSDEHPMHHLLYVMIEVKTPYNAILVDDLLAALEAQILAVWPRERVVTPDDVQGDAADLRGGLAERGWPTIAATRGKILVVLHDDGFWRDRYVEGGTSGRLLFPDAFGDLTLPFAAVHTLNDPVGDAMKIGEVVDAGHLVRTRADSDNVEPLAGDTSRGEAALASGATFISTDYPPPQGEIDYVFEIPDGTPSRCNPRTAPEDCTPAMIESP
jgi:hypothetical protein